jgi:hypothetical protein
MASGPEGLICPYRWRYGLKQFILTNKKSGTYFSKRFYAFLCVRPSIYPIINLCVYFSTSSSTLTSQNVIQTQHKIGKKYKRSSRKEIGEFYIFMCSVEF